MMSWVFCFLLFSLSSHNIITDPLSPRQYLFLWSFHGNSEHEEWLLGLQLSLNIWGAPETSSLPVQWAGDQRMSPMISRLSGSSSITPPVTRDKLLFRVETPLCIAPIAHIHIPGLCRVSVQCQCHPVTYKGGCDVTSVFRIRQTRVPEVLQWF